MAITDIKCAWATNPTEKEVEGDDIFSAAFDG